MGTWGSDNQRHLEILSWTLAMRQNFLRLYPLTKQNTTNNRKLDVCLEKTTFTLNSLKMFLIYLLPTDLLEGWPASSEEQIEHRADTLDSAILAHEIRLAKRAV